MSKENFDDKLTSFLRSNKPDVPSAKPEFEEQLLNATLRRSWRHRFNALFQPKWRMAFSVSVVALLIAIAVTRPTAVVQHGDSPMLVATKTTEFHLDDEDIYAFFVESWDGVQGNNNTDVLSAFDSI